MKTTITITVDPSKRCGSPCIRDTRSTVCDVLAYMDAMSDEDILRDFPNLTADDLLMCRKIRDNLVGFFIVP